MQGTSRTAVFAVFSVVQERRLVVDQCAVQRANRDAKLWQGPPCSFHLIGVSYLNSRREFRVSCYEIWSILNGSIFLRPYSVRHSLLCRLLTAMMQAKQQKDARFARSTSITEPKENKEVDENYYDSDEATCTPRRATTVSKRRTSRPFHQW